MKQRFPDARHICFGYRFGGGSSVASQGCSDDGEPSGSAGKPIVNVIQHNDVGNVSLFVVRYFGGIKLGVGGLVRAYGATASELMTHGTWQPYIEQKRIAIRFDFASESMFRNKLTELGAQLVDIDYGTQVTATVDANAEFEAWILEHRTQYSMTPD